MITAREAATRTIYQVIEEKQSLSQLLPLTKHKVREPDRALYAALVYGVLREYGALSALRDSLLSKPLNPKDIWPAYILNVGIYQLLRMQLGDHGVLNETVNLCKVFRVGQVRGLVNAILRRVQRSREDSLAQLERLKRHNLPDWLLVAHKTRANDLAQAFLQHPPMTLRIRAPETPAQWLEASGLSGESNPLHPQALTLTPPQPVEKLLGFAEGACSVQDAAAQWAATLLAPKNGERLLDACAAPGGKTGHLLELAPEAQLIALDQDSVRLARVEENLARLQLKATCQTANAADTQIWWDKTPFDAILLDAPCSGSGVLRRHPDIGFLRSAKDLQQLPKTQYRLLSKLWATLKPGGRLLYSTCSIMPRENQLLIEQFLLSHTDATLIPSEVPLSDITPFGTLHYPDTYGDGFFYALLRKAL